MNFNTNDRGFADLRVTLRDEEVADLMSRFPKLSRTEISDAVVRAGPMLCRVEAELTRLSTTKR
jgi:hypothetical protein